MLMANNFRITPDALSSNVRAVVDVAAFFDELKRTARELVERAESQERGYFTPDEEEETLALLISYWQARNAIFELIHSCRLDAVSDDEDYPLVFLTAYAGALVLVDAARFLRETVHDRPLVREKLNEPAPQFGIPAGVYDHVQRSLVSARHAWHLYFAAQYFQQNQEMLRSLADTSDYRPLLKVIDRLQARVDVSIRQFTRVNLRTRSSQLVQRMARNLLWRAMYGLQKFGGTIVADKYVRRGHRPGLPDDIAIELRNLLHPGDVIIVRKEYALTNYCLPGYWPHAALFLGNEQQLTALGFQDHEHVTSRWSKLTDDKLGHHPFRVLESMKDGVHIRALDSPFASDSVVVLRPKLDNVEIPAALARGLAHEGKSYDFDFDFRRSDRLVCTEVVFRAYDRIGPMRLPLKTRAGRPTLATQDIIEMSVKNEQFEPIAVYAPNLITGIADGQAAAEVLRRGEQLPSPEPPND